MAKITAPTITWRDAVEDHDYPAAQSYLSLIYPKAEVARLLARLRKARVTPFKAKDIFRAAQLPILNTANYHVAKDLARIRKGKALSPLLLVRDSANGKVIVADGYHRMCAVYGFDEDADIFCKIV